MNTRMVYRSDWPETGSSAPMSPVSGVPPLRSDGTEWGVCSSDEASGAALEVRAVLNGFESNLYRTPCWELRIQVLCDGDALRLLASPAFRAMVETSLHTVETKCGKEPAYVYAKVVATEPVYGELVRNGFTVVEHRCLYQSRIGDLSAGELADGEAEMDYRSLASLSSELQGGFREQMLDVCRESFSDGGSRHFRDPFLAGRVAGTDYILAVMRVNFDKVPPAGFLLAIDRADGTLAGFSVVGKKPSLGDQTYTQLLSAVRAGYRGRGIYGRISRFLVRNYPPDAVLLNVTHQQNEPIRRAYETSGRRHLADTVVVRRVFGDSVVKAGSTY